MLNNDMPCFHDGCRHAFDLKQGAHLWGIRYRSTVNWDEFVLGHVMDNEVMLMQGVSLVINDGIFQ